MKETWAILELLGHRRLAGIICEETIAGVGMIRIDVPDESGKRTTQFYAPGALYCLTPTDEATARAFAVANQPQPVQRWELAPLPDQKAMVCPGEDPWGDSWHEDGEEADDPPLTDPFEVPISAGLDALS